MKKKAEELIGDVKDVIWWLRGYIEAKENREESFPITTDHLKSLEIGFRCIYQCGKEGTLDKHNY
jgi:hypothetical protein